MENEYTIGGIIIALITVLKGKDIWDYLRSINESKTNSNQKLMDVYKQQLDECQERSKNAERKNELLTSRLEKHILKSKGKREK